MMSALPPKADINWRCLDVRFVPILLQKSAMTGRSGLVRTCWVNRLLIHSLIREWSHTTAEP